MAIDGAEIKIKVDGDVLAQQTGATHDDSRNMIDAAHKDKDHANPIYGKEDGSVSLDFLVQPDANSTPAVDALDTALKNKNELTIVIEENGTELGSATALIENVSREYPDDDTATASADLQLKDRIE